MCQSEVIPVEEVSVSASELCAMLAVCNWFGVAEHDVVYRSLGHVGQCFEGREPSKTLRRLLSKMLRLGFFVPVGPRGVRFDGEVFEVFVDEHPIGRVLWEYVGSRVTYIRGL